MVTIKKYGNRRLYDTRRATYINLSELATLVRQGETVKVVDAQDGSDLTREVLLQVIAEDATLLPVSMLHRVIRASGDDPWSRLLRQQLSAGLELMGAQLDTWESGLRPRAEVRPEPSAEEPSMAAEPPGPGYAAGGEDPEMEALRRRLAALESRLKR